MKKDSQKGKVIVTGGCGYIGSHTSVALIENGFDVVIIDDLSNSNVFILSQIQKITSIKPIFEKIDLKDMKTTSEVLERHKDAIAVIHFAAFKAVGESMQKPLNYYQNNIYTLVNTLKSQIDNIIPRMIFSSSATVYGEPENLPISEEQSVKRPFSVYGNTKKIAEEIIGDTVKANPGFSAISLRYFNPIGAHDSGLIGDLPNGIPNNLMPYITQTAIGVRSELNVFGDDYNTEDGTPIRDYIHVMDLAEAHVRALQYMLKSERKDLMEVFNLGTGKGVSVLEMIQAFESITKQKLNYRIVDRREGDVPKLYASSNLAKMKLGWEAKRGLNEMIQSSWRWEKKFREGSIET